MEALFDVAEFCGSLVYAHQGARKRSHFRPAVLLANETVEDCVGGNVPKDMLRQLQPKIAKLGRHREHLFQQLNEEEDEFAGVAFCYFSPAVCVGWLIWAWVTDMR